MDIDQKNRLKKEAAIKAFPENHRKQKYKQYDTEQEKVFSFEEQFDKKLVSIVKILKKENLSKYFFFERVMKLLKIYDPQNETFKEFMIREKDTFKDLREKIDSIYDKFYNPSGFKKLLETASNLRKINKNPFSNNSLRSSKRNTKSINNFRDDSESYDTTGKHSMDSSPINKTSKLRVARFLDQNNQSKKSNIFSDNKKFPKKLDFIMSTTASEKTNLNAQNNKMENKSKFGQLLGSLLNKDQTNDLIINGEDKGPSINSPSKLTDQNPEKPKRQITTNEIIKNLGKIFLILGNNEENLHTATREWKQSTVDIKDYFLVKTQEKKALYYKLDHQNCKMIPGKNEDYYIEKEIDVNEEVAKLRSKELLRKLAKTIPTLVSFASDREIISTEEIDSIRKIEDSNLIDEKKPDETKPAVDKKTEEKKLKGTLFGKALQKNVEFNNEEMSSECLDNLKNEEISSSSCDSNLSNYSIDEIMIENLNLHY